MAYTGEIIEIKGVKIKVAIGTYGGGTEGKTQTINVYDDTDIEGNYREVYQLTGPKNFVTPTRLTQRAGTLEELEEYLMGRGATKKGPRRRRR